MGGLPTKTPRHADGTGLDGLACPSDEVAPTAAAGRAFTTDDADAEAPTAAAGRVFTTDDADAEAPTAVAGQAFATGEAEAATERAGRAYRTGETGAATAHAGRAFATGENAAEAATDFAAEAYPTSEVEAATDYAGRGHSPADAEPRVGDVLGAKYRIVRVLGEGGMGLVFEAENLLTHKRVALKWMLPSAAKDAVSTARFMREARAVAHIAHPNVVDVYDVSRHRGAPFLVMELLRGDAANALIGEEPLPPQVVVDLLMPALRGIHAAHEKGVIHRDLKPDNIFFCRDEAGDFVTSKVLDFGISKALADNDIRHGLTKTGMVLGTPLYMSPEQIRGSKDLDLTTDVYALGVILYEALTGELPFEAETFTALAVEIATASVEPLRSHVPDLDPALEAVVVRALARAPRERFQSVAELATMLEPFGTVHFDEGRVSLPRLDRARDEPSPGSDREAATRDRDEPELDPDRLPDPPLPAPASASLARDLPPAARKPPSPARTHEPSTATAATELPMSRWPLIVGGGVALLLLLMVGGYFAWSADETPPSTRESSSAAAAHPAAEEGEVNPEIAAQPVEPVSPPASPDAVSDTAGEPSTESAGGPEAADEAADEPSPEPPAQVRTRPRVRPRAPRDPAPRATEPVREARPARTGFRTHGVSEDDF